MNLPDKFDNKDFVLKEGRFFMIKLDKIKKGKYFGVKNFFSSKDFIKTSLFKLDNSLFVSRVIRIPFSFEDAFMDEFFVNTLYDKVNANAFTYRHSADEEIAGEIFRKAEIQFYNIPKKYISKKNLVKKINFLGG